MDNRIEVEKEIRSSNNHEHFRFILITLIGMILPFTLWITNYGKIESSIWWGFFTVVMILVTVTSFLIGFIKTMITIKTMIHYKKVLTMYTNIDESTHIPQTAIVTTCLRPDSGRFRFQKINYYFWVDATELVFFPVRPDFSNSRSYQVIQSVRLNELMVRSYSLIGNQYDDGIKSTQEQSEFVTKLSYRTTSNIPIYRDTRATLISYAVGEQTIYLIFDERLYMRIKHLLPLKDKFSIESKETHEESVIINEPEDIIIEDLDSTKII